MSGAIGFILDGKHYDLASIDRLTLRDAIRFDREAVREDYGITWSGLLALAEQASHLPPEEALTAEGTWLLLGATVWATRREAGEDIGFGDAVDFKFGDVQWIRAPEDHKVAKDPRKPRPAKASGRGAKPAARRSTSSR